jgi:large subunit ribosomal protein L21
MFYVIETGGKQYLLKTGEKVKVEKLLAEAGSELVLDKVLLTAKDDGTDVKIGTPYLSGAELKVEVIQQGRAKKIRVVKYKRKVRYTRNLGHRQHFTEVKVK